MSAGRERRLFRKAGIGKESSVVYNSRSHQESSNGGVMKRHLECPDCGSPIRSRAEACPSCGRAGATSWIRRLGVLLLNLAVVVFFIIMILAALAFLET